MYLLNQLGLSKQFLRSMEELLTTYQLGEVLGTGTTSCVRKAIHIPSQQPVAIKMITLQQTNIPLSNVRNEIQILMRLDHPNIINIFDVIEGQGEIYVVMEFMAGGELYEHIAQKRQFGQVEACIFLRKIVDAIRYCHTNGIIHRDIKAENLLLSTNGPDCTLKLADFGLAKVLESENTSTFCGTPMYMAPEILENKSYNQSVDIWSIGVTMFYMLSGEYPFQGEGPELSQSIRKCRYQFAGDAWSMITYKAKSLIKRMLSLEPSQRPTAQQLSSDQWFVETIQLQFKRSINLQNVINRIKKSTMRKKVARTIVMVSDIVKLAEEDHTSKMRKFTLVRN